MLLIISREEGGQLQDILLQDLFQRRSLVQILDGKHLLEDAVHITCGVKDGNVFLANNDEAISLSFRILNDGHHITLGNGLAGHKLVTDETQGSIRRDISVNEVFDGTKVRKDNRWSTCSDIHVVSVSLCLCQCKDGRRRYLMCLETNQRTIDIEEKGISFTHTK